MLCRSGSFIADISSDAKELYRLCRWVISDYAAMRLCRWKQKDILYANRFNQAGRKVQASKEKDALKKKANRQSIDAS